MKTAYTRRRAPQQHATHRDSVILRWVFTRGSRAITCEVRRNESRFDVCVVPHWSVGASVIERYYRSVPAMQRHAEIAQSFREAGWLLVHETALAA